MIRSPHFRSPHKKIDNAGMRAAGAWILIMTIFILQLLFYAWCRVQCVNIGYDISKEMENYQELVTIQNTLKIELERLRSPEIISLQAKDLKLFSPKPSQQFSIPDRSPILFP